MANHLANTTSLPVAAASLPTWSLKATAQGEPNSWFDADEAAKHLTAEQRSGLPEIIRRAAAGNTPAGLQVASFTTTLNKIGARVQPGLDQLTASAWLAGLLESLSRIPLDILRKAIDAASHKQFRFLNEVGPWIEEEVKDDLFRRRRILNRLREIELRAKSLPLVADSPADPDEIDRIMNEFRAKMAGQSPTKDNGNG